MEEDESERKNCRLKTFPIRKRQARESLSVAPGELQENANFNTTTLATRGRDFIRKTFRRLIRKTNITPRTHRFMTSLPQVKQIQKFSKIFSSVSNPLNMPFDSNRWFGPDIRPSDKTYRTNSVTPRVDRIWTISDRRKIEFLLHLSGPKGVRTRWDFLFPQPFTPMPYKNG